MGKNPKIEALSASARILFTSLDSGFGYDCEDDEDAEKLRAAVYEIAERLEVRAEKLEQRHSRN